MWSRLRRWLCTLLALSLLISIEATIGLISLNYLSCDDGAAFGIGRIVGKGHQTDFACCRRARWLQLSANGGFAGSYSLILSYLFTGSLGFMLGCFLNCSACWMCSLIDS